MTFTHAGWGAWRADPLWRSTASLIASGALTAALGMVFWVLATRLYAPAAVGRDAALIAVMVELSVVCQLNLNNAITRFLPGVGERTAAAVLRAYGLSGMAAVVCGGLFLAFAPLASGDFAFLRDDWHIACLYVIAQALWGWFTLEDAVLVALRRAPWVPLENGAFALLKLAALPLLVSMGFGHGIFLAWVLPVAVVALPVNLLLFRRVIPRHVRERPAPRSQLHGRGRRRLVAFVAQDYAASVAAKASSTLLPILIVAVLGATSNAYYYIPATIVLAFDMMFDMVGIALVAEGAFAEQRTRALAVAVTRRFGGILVVGVVGLCLAAPLVLAPFGEQYVHEGTAVLRIIAWASLFRGVITLYTAVARLQGRGTRILAVQLTLTALTLAGSVVLMKPWGITGVAVAWVGSTLIVAVAMVPSLLAFLRTGRGLHEPRQARARVRMPSTRGRVAAVAAVAPVLAAAALLGGTDARRSTPREPSTTAPATRAHARLVWHDEFTGAAGSAVDARRWRYDVGGRWGNGTELQSYTARRENVRLDGRGHLVITARRERYRGSDGVARAYTSGRLNTQHRFEFAYGRIAARIRVPAGRGLLPAFWAIGRDVDRVGWPRVGEFDVMEVHGTNPSMVLGSIHGPAPGGEAYGLTVSHALPHPASRGFHIYSVAWAPRRLDFAIDGRRYAVWTARSLRRGERWPFDRRRFFLLLSLAVGGPWAGRPDSTTRWPARMVVDWVRLWGAPETSCRSAAFRGGRCRAGSVTSSVERGREPRTP